MRAKMLFPAPASHCGFMHRLQHLATRLAACQGRPITHHVSVMSQHLNSFTYVLLFTCVWCCFSVPALQEKVDASWWAASSSSLRTGSCLMPQHHNFLFFEAWAWCCFSVAALQEKVDRKLVGGFILEFEDRLVDMSVRKKLEEFNALVFKLETDLKA
jgi:hypothetical protein